VLAGRGHGLTRFNIWDLPLSSKLRLVCPSAANSNSIRASDYTATSARPMIRGDELALSAGVTGFQILGPSNWMLPLRGA